MHRFRDQAMMSQFVGAMLALLVAFNLGVSDEQAALWLSAITMLFSVVAAALVKPWAPSIFTGLISSAASLAVAYGFEIDPGQLGAVTFAVSMGVGMFFMRPNSTPKSDPAVGQGVTSKDAPGVAAHRS